MDLTAAIGNALLPSPPTRSERGANMYGAELNRAESLTLEEAAGRAAAAVQLDQHQPCEPRAENLRARSGRDVPHRAHPASQAELSQRAEKRVTS